MVGVVVYVASAVFGSSSSSTARALGAGANVPTIVFAADRVPVLFGEIYRVGLDGRRTNLTRSAARDVSPVVSPDGRWVAFASDRGGYAALYIVGLDGRGLRRLSPRLFRVGPGSGLAAQIAWSPNGRRIAVAASGAAPGQVLYVGDLDGRGQLITRDVVASPTWSPDGRLIAFSTGLAAGNLNAVRIVTPTGATAWRVRGTGLRHQAWSRTGRLAISAAERSIRVYDEQGRLLTSFPGQAFAWSPDGDRLANMNGNRLEVRPGGSGRPVLSVPALKPNQVFSQGSENAVEWVGDTHVGIATDAGWTGIDLASGRAWRPPKLAFGTVSLNRSRAAAPSTAGRFVRLEVSRLDGSDPQALARVPACINDSPIGDLQFTPDGQSLVYQSNCLEPSADLYAIDPDGSRLRRLTRTPEHETEPNWSPDGNSITYVQQDTAGLACHGCAESISVMDATGAHPQQLTSSSYSGIYDDSPSWSPDGRQIVFSRSTPTSYGKLLVIPSAGGNAHDLHVTGSKPAWGPSRIAYVGKDYRSIWTIAPDGSHRQRIATIAIPLALAWSHNGRLAYVERRNTAVVIHITGGAMPGFQVPFCVASLAWSPDDKTLLLSPPTGDATFAELYSIGVDGRHLTRLTSNMGATYGATWR